MGRKVTTRRRKSMGIGSLMFPFTTFIMGYLVASVFDMSHLNGWVSSNLFNRSGTTLIKTAQVQPVELPKPKFEFYTLLTKEQSRMPESAAFASASSAASKPIAVAVTQSNANTTASKIDAAPIDLTVTQKLPLHEPLVAAMTQPKSNPVTTSMATPAGRYIIQVGSFRNSREAEKMRATLVIRGFTAMITSSTQQQVTWYRVLIGPFESIADAQRVHREFAQRERITGMIRKLDA